MGNSRSYVGPKPCPRFLPEEQAEIDKSFDVLTAGQGGRTGVPAHAFSLQALKSYLGQALPAHMVARLYDGMRGVDPAGKAQVPSESVSREQFVLAMSHLLKGDAAERSTLILKMIAKTGGPVRAQEVQRFTEDLVGSVAHVLAHRQELRGWLVKTPVTASPRVRALATQLLSEMKLPGGEVFLSPQWLDRDCDHAVLEDWVSRVPHMATFLSVVVHRGFLLRSSPLPLATLVPKRIVDPGQDFESMLDILSVIYINSHLPREQQRCWRLLFSSQLHGHSFSQLCGRVAQRGPCVTLLEDHDGHVFGGFASCSWEVKPQFQGDNRCFLFSICPSMAVYMHSGYNNHYMYLNHSQQTIPNGLGMGGQHHYFGLWVDADFGKGHSKAKPTCTTYNSPQLSAQEDFRFDKMEVWAVGESEESLLATSKKSILDVDPEAQALLEISGRARHSEGLREGPDCDQ